MKRSKFSLSHYKLLSGMMGELIPCGLTEVLPGDTLQQATSAFLRCTPMLTPVMHPVHVRIHHWFVPHRLVWDDWESFITGGEDGMDDSVFPTITFASPQGVGSLADYLGVVPGIAGLEVSALPFRGYAKIWNEFYRDQDLQTELTIDTSSGPDTTTNTALQNSAWEKDYFTSARPWEQKGPAITIPLGTTAPVGTAASATFTGIQPALKVNVATTGNAPGGAGSIGFDAAGNVTGDAGTFAPDVTFYPNNLQADLQNASAITINLLREAFALQRFEEARARFGSRYVEYLRYLGVRSSDARLQRPEYLGGGKQTIQFSEVLQTGEGTDPVGTMRGHGIGAMRSNRYRRFFEEHGYVFSFINVKPKTIYAQGLARHLNRRVKEDFWQKELQHIGQQEILNKEIYAIGTAADNDTFGFQDRYDEYRRTPSTIAGAFRDNTYWDWHFARLFASAPALNADFVKSVPAVRPFAIQDDDTLLMMINHSIQARRMVAASGTSFIL